MTRICTRKIIREASGFLFAFGAAHQAELFQVEFEMPGRVAAINKNLSRRIARLFMAEDSTHGGYIEPTGIFDRMFEPMVSLFQRLLNIHDGRSTSRPARPMLRADSIVNSLIAKEHTMADLFLPPIDIDGEGDLGVEISTVWDHQSSPLKPKPSDWGITLLVWRPVPGEPFHDGIIFTV